MDEQVSRRAEISKRLVQAAGNFKQQQRLHFEYRLVNRIVKLCNLDKKRLPQDWTLRTLQEVYRLPVYLFACDGFLEQTRRDLLSMLVKPDRCLLISEWERFRTLAPPYEEHAVVWRVYRAPSQALVLYRQGRRLMDVGAEALYVPYRGDIFCLTKLEAILNADSVTIR